MKEKVKLGAELCALSKILEHVDPDSFFASYTKYFKNNFAEFFFFQCQSNFNKLLIE